MTHLPTINIPHRPIYRNMGTTRLPFTERTSMITVDFATSPQGKPCITMTTEGGQEWILFTVKRGPLADTMMRQLKSDFQVEALPGIPLDVRASLQSQKLIFYDANGVMGVYVQSGKFDWLVDLMGDQL